MYEKSKETLNDHDLGLQAVMFPLIIMTVFEFFKVTFVLV